ncbi:hypothetical protein SAMN05660293_00428 [Dyadobacter psychrophilus]|uniref:Uncharacterized protein n=1 Tax=Dyadobacter psychrophilus TaxID=651661 RepID=A0A1T5BKM5_9BACT|nr:hypothetical protein SAMN05660293_00428 [Dyadobacter psychrophilus]
MSYKNRFFYRSHYRTNPVQYRTTYVMFVFGRILIYKHLKADPLTGKIFFQSI